MAKYHIHGIAEIVMCFTLEAATEQDAQTTVGRAIKHMIDEVQSDEEDKDEPTFIAVPHEATVKDINFGVSDNLGWEDNDEPSTDRPPTMH